jgi:hypothetical protein
MLPARLPADFCTGSRPPIGWAEVRSIKVRSIKDYAGNYAGLNRSRRRSSRRRRAETLPSGRRSPLYCKMLAQRLIAGAPACRGVMKEAVFSSSEDRIRASRASAAAAGRPIVCEAARCRPAACLEAELVSTGRLRLVMVRLNTFNWARFNSTAGLEIPARV